MAWFAIFRVLVLFVLGCDLCFDDDLGYLWGGCPGGRRSASGTWREATTGWTIQTAWRRAWARQTRRTRARRTTRYRGRCLRPGPGRRRTGRARVRFSARPWASARRRASRSPRQWCFRARACRWPHRWRPTLRFPGALPETNLIFIFILFHFFRGLEIFEVVHFSVSNYLWQKQMSYTCWLVYEIIVECDLNDGMRSIC